jgi:hypothetical protein
MSAVVGTTQVGAAKGASGASPAAKPFLSSKNPHDLVRLNGYDNAFKVDGKSAGTIITRKTSDGTTPIPLSAEQIASLPTLIQALVDCQIGLQPGSRTLLEGFLPTGDAEPSASSDDTVINLQVTSDTAEIPIPTSTTSAAEAGKAKIAFAPVVTFTTASPILTSQGTDYKTRASQIIQRHGLTEKLSVVLGRAKLAPDEFQLMFGVTKPTKEDSLTYDEMISLDIALHEISTTVLYVSYNFMADNPAQPMASTYKLIKGSQAKK